MTSRQRERVRSGGRDAVKGAALAVAVALVSLLAVGWSSASAQQDPEPPAATVQELDSKAPAERRFRPVLEQVVRGDLVMAGNSNLLSAGGWREGDVTVADVDGDASELCIIRGLGFPRACADNSSSARLDIPDGARVVEARLYVQTTVAPDVGPLRVRLDGPGRPFAYTELGGATLGVRKLYEAAAAGRRRARRCARRCGTSPSTSPSAAPARTPSPTSSPSGPRRTCPYASWAIVAAYEFDPRRGQRARRRCRVEERQRFAAARRVVVRRVHLPRRRAPVEVPVSGFDDPDDRAASSPRASTSSATASTATPDNLLFNGNPLGNNLTPGDAPPPAGVVIGGEPVVQQHDRRAERHGVRARHAGGDEAPRAEGVPRLR